jgi:hypothetical protein
MATVYRGFIHKPDELCLQRLRDVERGLANPAAAFVAKGMLISRVQGHIGEGGCLIAWEQGLSVL